MKKVVVNLAIKETDPEWVNWVWCIAGQWNDRLGTYTNFERM